MQLLPQSLDQPPPCVSPRTFLATATRRTITLEPILLPQQYPPLPCRRDLIQLIVIREADLLALCNRPFGHNLRFIAKATRIIMRRRVRYAGMIEARNGRMQPARRAVSKGVCLEDPHDFGKEVGPMCAFVQSEDRFLLGLWEGGEGGGYVGLCEGLCGYGYMHYGGFLVDDFAGGDVAGCDAAIPFVGDGFYGEGVVFFRHGEWLTRISTGFGCRGSFKADYAWQKWP